MLKGLYVLGEGPWSAIYGPEERADIERYVDIYAPQQTPNSVKKDPAVMGEAEVIFSGWGAPRMDAEFLAAAPKLKAVFYGAGSVRGMVTEALWDKGIVVTSSYGANAIPVAEYCVSQILFCLKLGWRHALTIKERGNWTGRYEVPGAYRSRVGLVSLGMIGRKTLELLRSFDVQIGVYSTSLTPEKATALNVALCSLEDIFKTCDVVSLHTPDLPETKGMITGTHFASMKKDASFINTARRAVVHELEMIDVLRERPDITVVLDVTFPEPPPGSPLYTLPNVVMTPHIAGAMGNECRRMGRYAVEEMKRYVKGEPLQWAITREMAERLA